VVSRSKPVRIELTKNLPVALREGFDYITDVRNWPEYWPHFVEIPEGDAVRWREAGDRAAVVIETRGRPTELRMTLEEFVPTACSRRRMIRPVIHEAGGLCNGTGRGRNRAEGCARRAAVHERDRSV
jgi:hypothetical protein